MTPATLIKHIRLENINLIAACDSSLKPFTFHRMDGHKYNIDHFLSVGLSIIISKNILTYFEISDHFPIECLVPLKDVAITRKLEPPAREETSKNKDTIRLNNRRLSLLELDSVEEMHDRFTAVAKFFYDAFKAISGQQKYIPRSVTRLIKKQ